MRRLSLALVLSLLFVSAGSAQTGLSGTWKISKFSPVNHLMADFDITLNLKAEGKQLTGKAKVENLSDATISDGIVNGQRFSFTLMTPAHVSSGGPWKMTFEGTIQGDTLKLFTAYGWGNWLDTAGTGHPRLEVEAKRVQN